MDFKSLLSQLDQLNEEGTTVHKGTYGTSHGKEDVRDQYGHKIGKQDKGAEVKKDAPKKGRGRPKKGADDSGEVKSYDFSAFGVNKGKDVKLPKYDKKKTGLIIGKGLALIRIKQLSDFSKTRALVIYKKLSEAIDVVKNNNQKLI